MSKKSIRIISTLLTIGIVLMMLTTSAFAITNPNQLKGTEDKVKGTDTIVSAGNKIVTLIRTVAMVVAVIVLMVLGIKYMMGSAEEKASYKKTMMPYFIGAILVFAAAAIAGMVFDFASGLNNNS